MHDGRCRRVRSRVRVRGTDTVTRMSVPTALVQMKIQDLPTSVDEMVSVHCALHA